MSEKKVIADMLTKISPESFYQAFGAPMEQAADLLAAKTLSISKLMVLMPPGTLDPTPHIYDSTMYALSGLMAVAFVSHAMVRPLSVAAASSAAAKITEVKENAQEAQFTEKTETLAGDRQTNK